MKYQSVVKEATQFDLQLIWINNMWTFDLKHPYHSFNNKVEIKWLEYFLLFLLNLLDLGLSLLCQDNQIILPTSIVGFLCRSESKFRCHTHGIWCFLRGLFIYWYRLLTLAPHSTDSLRWAVMTGTKRARFHNWSSFFIKCYPL